MTIWRLFDFWHLEYIWLHFNSHTHTHTSMAEQPSNTNAGLSGTVASGSIKKKGRNNRFKYPRPSTCPHPSEKHREHANGVCYQCSKNIQKRSARRSEKEKCAEHFQATPSVEQANLVLCEVAASAIQSITQASVVAQIQCADLASQALLQENVDMQSVLGELIDQLTEIAQLTRNALEQLQLQMVYSPSMQSI